MPISELQSMRSPEMNMSLLLRKLYKNDPGRFRRNLLGPREEINPDLPGTGEFIANMLGFRKPTGIGDALVQAAMVLPIGRGLKAAKVLAGISKNSPLRAIPKLSTTPPPSATKRIRAFHATRSSPKAAIEGGTEVHRQGLHIGPMETALSRAQIFDRSAMFQGLIKAPKKRILPYELGDLPTNELNTLWDSSIKILQRGGITYPTPGQVRKLIKRARQDTPEGINLLSKITGITSSYTRDITKVRQQLKMLEKYDVFPYLNVVERGPTSSFFLAVPKQFRYREIKVKRIGQEIPKKPKLSNISELDMNKLKAYMKSGKDPYPIDTKLLIQKYEAGDRSISVISELSAIFDEIDQFFYKYPLNPITKTLPVDQAQQNIVNKLSQL